MARAPGWPRPQDQLAATREMLSVLARSSSTQDDVFDAVVQNACRICRAQVAQIHVADGDVFQLVCVARGGPRLRRVLGSTTPSPANRDSLVGRVALDDRTQQIDDVLADPDYNRPDFQQPRGVPVHHRARR